MRDRDIQEVDFRHVTDSRSGFTRVNVYTDPLAHPKPWLLLGRTFLRQHERTRIWTLGAYLKDATDAEHDFAYALRLPLVGVSLMGVEVMGVRLEAWIATIDDYRDRATSFRVPAPGHNPLSGATRCRECRSRHPIVPEGSYAGPPLDAELYERVVGLRVEIVLGTP